MIETIQVNPARLSHGQYDYEAAKMKGKGDIMASYSGDAIAMGQPVREPYKVNGELFVTVGSGQDHDSSYAKGYRLVSPRLFRRPTTTYAEKVQRDHGESARRDPQGFYDGITVMREGVTYVMCGPVVYFRPNEEQPAPATEELQLALF